MGNSLAWTPCADYFNPQPPGPPAWLKPTKLIKVDFCHN